MTSRSHGHGPVGISGRLDLFSPRVQINDSNNIPSARNLSAQEGSRPNLVAGGQQSAQNHPPPSSSNELDLPIELERVIGYNPLPRGLICHPANESLVVKSLGCLVAVESLDDPHLQRIFRAHDMDVSAIDVSPSGRLVASGQVGTQHVKGYSAPVFVWQMDTGRRIVVLKGLLARVHIAAFSPDERFVFGAGEDGMFLVWDIASGEAVCGQRTAAPVSVMVWLGVTVEHREPVYRLCIGSGAQLSSGVLFFDKSRMQWQLSLEPFSMPPSGGIVRSFRSIAVSVDAGSVLVGTSAGEVLTFRTAANIFRGCVGVCSNGVNAIAVLPDGQLLCGGGDGSLCLLRGAEAGLRKVAEVALDGGVVSLSLSSNRLEAIVGLSNGRSYRTLLANLSSHLIGAAPLDGVTVSCWATRQPGETCFLTGSEAGELRLWDLVDYACLAAVRTPKAGRCSALAAVDYDGQACVIAAFADGSVRCWERRTLARQLWSIPEAHKRGTCSLSVFADAGSQFMVMGGGDGVVRVWLLRNRELVTQFSEHRREVCAVLVDALQPHLVHSACVDGAVISFDLKSGRRLISHAVVGGSAMTCMAQRRDAEREVVVGDSRGRLLQFDVDVREAVAVVQEPSRTAIYALAVSPSGVFLAVAGEDSLLKVLLMKSGEVLCTASGHSGAILNILWTADERQIISGGSDGCICVWNFHLGQLSGSAAELTQHRI